MALHAAVHDHDGSGRPLLTAEAEDRLTRLQDELEARPAFIHEACEDMDPAQLADAVNRGDAAALLALIQAAIKAKREREAAATLRGMYDANERDALAHLVRLYA